MYISKKAENSSCGQVNWGAATLEMLLSGGIASSKARNFLSLLSCQAKHWRT